MSISKDPYSLYFPIKLGCLKLFAFIDENLHVEDDECISKPHSHHIYELRYIESGECTQLIDGVTFTAQTHDIILVRPGEYHYQKPVLHRPENSQYSIRFRIDEPTSSVPAYQTRALNTFNEILSSTRCVKDEQDILAYMFKRLEFEISEKSYGYIHNLQLLTTLIMTEFIRYTDISIKAIFPPEDIKYRGLMLTKLEQFFSWKYPVNDIKIQDLANDIKISKRHTARVLQQVYGMTFSKKLTEVRIQHAAFQLINTNLTIEEISKKCGFNNSSYFYMSFKKKHGITPSEFRQKNQTASNFNEEI